MIKEVVCVFYRSLAGACECKRSDDLRSNETHLNEKARSPAGALVLFARPTRSAHDFRGPPLVLMSYEAMRIHWEHIIEKGRAQERVLFARLLGGSRRLRLMSVLLSRFYLILFAPLTISGAPLWFLCLMKY
jgi:hypothetical protein